MFYYHVYFFKKLRTLCTNEQWNTEPRNRRKENDERPDR